MCVHACVMCGHGQDSDRIYIGCCCVSAFVRDLCSFKTCSTYVCMLIEDLTHVSECPEIVSVVRYSLRSTARDETVSSQRRKKQWQSLRGLVSLHSSVCPVVSCVHACCSMSDKMVYCCRRRNVAIVRRETVSPQWRGLGWSLVDVLLGRLPALSGQSWP